jgi:hypothetical protein
MNARSPPLVAISQPSCRFIAQTNKAYITPHQHCYRTATPRLYRAKCTEGLCRPYNINYNSHFNKPPRTQSVIRNGLFQSRNRTGIVFIKEQSSLILVSRDTKPGNLVFAMDRRFLASVTNHIMDKIREPRAIEKRRSAQSVEHETLSRHAFPLSLYKYNDSVHFQHLATVASPVGDQ